ncbi:L-threonylcarbamoyladenylate synthase [Aerococcus sanguinicola]|uniref:L-threonylcarbamoyladenylate synthase n=1 Tax=unclassified Aerococcus TaxID=2618060 RepID=UPI0008A43B4F|nr:MULTISPECIES: L-threonylcarbamoyladenylate synthase [unclassified Aerococcus]KAB0645977.1 threonylcarbamoyl-AMP synthase [Aerococcus sanguinicola]MDK6234260.1 L-threonylcarbamoyladenylate synthase [Aerococcus sp. UMB10185]MDK6855389.1 L-threonylcarbamoyladenylate synthase [Aerococcus sp. UMB7533]MDK8501566.1 L-threonylcarbamoyladenylate synthase [Aerococcus sp. UMB1112A]OFN05499.1 threonylcarbamoyl-AMP synthase [Aerococcus sp. HMSC062A02]
MTEIYQSDRIDEAAQQLRDGQLVAFPTETVFGLGAIANNDQAVQSVYQVKGRPSDNPLIVHLAHKEDLFAYVRDLTPDQVSWVKKLQEAFWPGPLTLILPVKEGVFAPTVTGGLDTVGLRMPDHPLTLELIEAVGFPLVGPSANLSGKPSPTKLDHVRHDFDGKIAGILASQPTRIGVESTVLDLSDPRGLFILRPGHISRGEIETVLDGPEVSYPDQLTVEADQQPKAPGMKYRHYSPHETVYAVAAERMAEVIQANTDKAIFCAGQEASLAGLPPVAQTYSLGPSLETATQRLFDALRKADDSQDIDLILVEWIDAGEASAGYQNRLLKASSQVFA